MAKRKQLPKATSSRAMEFLPRHNSGENSPRATEEAIQAAQEVALAAFASGLKLAAALSTVAAKTTSFALESLAMGADKFSELVKAEALGSTPRASSQGRVKKKSPRGPGENKGVQK